MGSPELQIECILTLGVHFLAFSDPKASSSRFAAELPGYFELFFEVGRNGLMIVIWFVTKTLTSTNES